MDLYEYIVIRDVNRDKLEDSLNETGKRGFRLVHIQPYQVDGSRYAVVVVERRIP